MFTQIIVLWHLILCTIKKQILSKWGLRITFFLNLCYKSANENRYTAFRWKSVARLLCPIYPQKKYTVLSAHCKWILKRNYFPLKLSPFFYVLALHFPKNIHSAPSQTYSLHSEKTFYIKKRTFFWNSIEAWLNVLLLDGRFLFVSIISLVLNGNWKMFNFTLNFTLLGFPY